MARNNIMRETTLLHSFEQQLRNVMPPGWALDAAREPGLRRGSGADLVLNVRAPDGARARIVVEVKRGVEPRDVSAILRQIAAYDQPEAADPELRHTHVVAAPFLSPRTRDLLAEAGVGWFDMTGNVCVRLDRPAIFIDRLGASRNPYREAGDRRLRSLRGPGAARVVRALLDGAGHLGVRDLAIQAGVGAATSSRVLDLLARDDLVERAPDGMVTTVRKQSLVRRWAQDYGLVTTNDSVPVLAPRGIDKLLRDLRTYERPYALTAGAALRAHLPAERIAVAPLTLLTAFVDDAVAVEREFGLRPADRGANVLLIEPFDDVVYRNASVFDRVYYVSPSQTVVDLLTGPGRSSEEGEQLLDVLAASDQEWSL